VSQDTSIEDREVEACRRLAGALDPSMIDALLADAKITGTPLDGVDGLLNQMTKAVIERALQAEITHDLGYERDDPAGVGTGNSRNGFSAKTMSTTNGPITIDVPRDRNGTFEPKIVPKRARRLGQIDEMILSLYSRGMSTRDIEAHLFDVYGVRASRELISNVTDVVADEIEIWRNRPVDEVYPNCLCRRVADQGPGQGRGYDQDRLPGHRGRRRGPQARPGRVDRRGRGREVLAVGAHTVAQPWAARHSDLLLRRPLRAA
jgi:hypothetical protein